MRKSLVSLLKRRTGRQKRLKVSIAISQANFSALEANQLQSKSMKPHRQIVIKFILLSGVFVGYFAYLSYEFDLMTGGVAALLTWSFFCSLHTRCRCRFSIGFANTSAVWCANGFF
jgi:hypothetical protein